ncbi:hypothetical protein SDC9_207470 [bioreactor metagenome]|uniref:Uncharacterized protein n=1 Tax=bioreactor metagenome TaxID=1076179 RepID=A0A645J7W1_9ZZZZ
MCYLFRCKEVCNQLHLLTIFNEELHMLCQGVHQLNNFFTYLIAFIQQSFGKYSYHIIRVFFKVAGQSFEKGIELFFKIAGYGPVIHNPVYIFM